MTDHIRRVESFLEFPNVAALDSWLANHADQTDGVWLRIGKKGKATGLIGIDDAGDVAMAHGWIDSKRRSFDVASFLQRYSPRKPGSPWSLVNVKRAEALIASGRMRPAGQRQIDLARKDGRWGNAYAPQRKYEIPADLDRALELRPRARQAFARLGSTARYLIVLPILKARSTAIRAARIEKAVFRLASSGRRGRVARASGRAASTGSRS